MIEDLFSDPAAEQRSWEQVTRWARRRYGREPSTESMLFLIGVHARAGDFQDRLKKEMKQDLIMEGTYAVLAELGIYEKSSGSWRRVATVPPLGEDDQERLLRIAICRYLARTEPRLLE